jgi:hypothetical protein
MPNNLADFMVQWPSLLKESFIIRLAITMLSNGILWGVCLAKNNSVFHNELMNWESIYDIILHRLALWLKLVDDNFIYTSMDLVRGSNGILKWSNK